jgi:hypothetical protein
MNIEIYDIEAYLELFNYMGYNIDTKQYVYYEISAFRDDGDAYIAHLNKSKIDYQVGFNSISYDSQVQQYIVENYSEWSEQELTGLEIAHIIHEFSNKRIADSNNEMERIFPPYRPWELIVKQIDLFTIHHFDNKAKQCRLKWLQFSMDYPVVEDSPVPFDKQGITEEDVASVKHYLKNDVDSTHEFYRFTRGQVEHEEYKGRE